MIIPESIKRALTLSGWDYLVTLNEKRRNSLIKL
jgi:hypothetical protein